MRDERRNYVIVGGFVIALVAALVVWVAALSGFLGRTDAYSIVYRNVTGLAPGGEVLFEGYRVGVIAKIAPVQRDGRQLFRVDIDVRHGWRIPTNSVAAIKAPSLLSAFAIDIEAGDALEPLSPGSEIEGQEVADVVGTVSDLAGQVAVLVDEIGPTVDSIGEKVPEVMENVRAFTTEANATVARVNEVLGPENRERLARILANVENASTDASRISAGLHDSQQKLSTTLARIDALIARNEPNVDRSLVDLHASLEAVAQRVDAITYNLEATTRNMNEFSREIRSNPGLLVRGRESGTEPGGGS